MIRGLPCEGVERSVLSEAPQGSDTDTGIPSCTAIKSVDISSTRGSTRKQNDACMRCLKR